MVLFIVSVTLLAACTETNKANQEINVSEQMEKIKVNKLAEDHWQTYTDVVINAPIEKVWKVLTDWDHLPNWSTSLQRIEGDVEHNGIVAVSYLVDGNTYATKHTFIYKELEEFGWSDPMEGSFEGLTDNHRFRVERISDHQTRFIQSDDFKGSGNETMSAQNVADVTVKFFPQFNRELKKEVEK